jgi:hypothetical protein
MGMEWPVNGDSEEYSEKFYDKARKMGLIE